MIEAMLHTFIIELILLLKINVLHNNNQCYLTTTLLLSANEFKLKLFLVNLVKLDHVAKGNNLTTGGNYFTTVSF